MFNIKRLTPLVLLLSILLVFGVTACQQAATPTPEPTTQPEIAAEAEASPTTEVLPPTNTPEPVPTDTPEPTPEPTEPAEPTATPEPEPTATPAAVTIDEEGVSFTYSPDLGIEGVQVNRLPAQALGVDGPPVYYADVPEFIQFTLDTAQGPATILVQPIRDEAGNLFASMGADLQQYYLDFDQQLLDESEGRLDQQQVAYIPFGNGKGLRALSYEFVTPGVAKISNENVYYYFDGVTEDGRYYVAMRYPIDAPGLDAGGQFTQEEFDAALVDFDGYVSDTLGPLDDLTLDSFTPDLGAIDDLVASLTIAADASTAVSPLVDCTYDAAYVEDVTIPDATVINPGEPFQKIWRVQNTGTCAWNSAFTAIFIDGNDINWSGFVQVDDVAPGETFDIVVDLQAPEEPGIYEGRWQMVDPLLRPFGIKVYVTIVVPEEPIEATPVPANG